MPNPNETDGMVEYKLKGQPIETSHQTILASHRQKKILQFFGVPLSQKITAGAAGWKIATLLTEDANRERWRRYLFPSTVYFLL